MSPIKPPIGLFALQYVAAGISAIAITYLLLGHGPVLFKVTGILLWGGFLFMAVRNARRFRKLRSRRQTESTDE